MKKLAIQSCRLVNFKAIHDSQKVEFTPLTVLIGSNGSGKSSLIEGLMMLQSIALNGLESAVQRWHGFRNIWHCHYQTNCEPMSFDLNGRFAGGNYNAKVEVGMGEADNLKLLRENITIGNKAKVTRNTDDLVTWSGEMNFDLRHFNGSDSKYGGGNEPKLSPNESVIGASPYLRQILEDWQFISLIPEGMGQPMSVRQVLAPHQLEQYGYDIAEYLQVIKNQSEASYESIIQLLRDILPYADQLNPVVSHSPNQQSYLMLSENNCELPGWVLSTGTLRLIALLALLRHPSPSPVIFIEEIENGLDPRALNLIVDEIRQAVESGRTQVIMTTHSPYLLDLLTLSQIVIVERINGEPVFTRPASRVELAEWARKFSPGKLYTMGKLNS